MIKDVNIAISKLERLVVTGDSVKRHLDAIRLEL